MAKLKRDERVCPICAETIKAAAIRCRFCQSQLTPQAEPQPEPVPVPVPESEPDLDTESEPDLEPDLGHADEESAGASKPSVWTGRKWVGRIPVQRRLTILLAMLVVLAGAGVGVSWWRAEQGSSAVAPGGSLVGDDARTQVLVRAADLTQRTLSYDYRTLANDMEVARARMTPSFRKEYESTMSQVRANTVENEIVLQAAVVSSAIIDATEQQATVLVFVNQTTTAGAGDDQNQQLTRNSLVITLDRAKGDWAMSELTALG